jgi:hypothetical protein
VDDTGEKFSRYVFSIMLVHQASGDAQAEKDEAMDFEQGCRKSGRSTGNTDPPWLQTYVWGQEEGQGLIQKNVVWQGM